MNPMPLLDLIAKHESENAAARQGVSSGYDVVVEQASRAYPPAKPITTMTVSEVLNWQREAIAETKQVYGSGYSAAGRYQVIRKTLQSLGASGKVLFDKETQDAIGTVLLYRRGWGMWIEGKLSTNAFADNLSKEWASLPYHTGRSYYDKDAHGNRSLVSREEVLQVLNTIRNQHISGGSREL